MAKIIHDLSLFDIAPPSIKADKTVSNVIQTVDPELLSVSDDTAEAFIISRIKELPEPVLDLLAWQWHVDFYDLANSLEARRDMVLAFIKWHRKKGTRAAILSALEMLGAEAKYIAWYEEEENKDNPYTFAIEAKLTDDFWERVDWTKPTQTIRRAITESKSARSFMSRLYVYFEDSITQNISIGAGAFTGSHYIIRPVFKSFDDTTKLNVSVAPVICPAIHQIVSWKFNSGMSTELSTATALGLVQGINTTIKMKGA